MHVLCYNFVVLLFVCLLVVVCNSISEKGLDLHRHTLSNDDDISGINQRFQQIMQGSDRWKESTSPKAEKIDVKAEIDKLNISYVYQPEWPKSSKKLGAVSAVSFDVDGNVVIFHRVDRLWTQTTFNMSQHYTEQSRGPINDNTIIAFDRKNGHIVYEWGKDLFYMPHGLTIDHENNIWVTDVALHQVLKFGPKGGNGKPTLSLGTPFVNGRGNNLFCKPSATAILPDGDFFVADGYCNARIVKYSKNGDFILQWGRNAFGGVSYDVAPVYYLAIPHALTLANDLGLVCVADRENGRVQCFYTNNGTIHSQYHSPIVGDRLFSVAYLPMEGGQLFVVNGPTAELGQTLNGNYNEVRGYVIDMKTKKVLSKFGPNDLQFSNPHDIIVTKDGSEIYVAELDPTKVHKFLNKRVAENTVYLSAAKPTATVNGDSADTAQTIIANTVQPTSTAILVISIISILALLIIGIILIVSRHRKRGCYPFEVRNRRHAWDFPTGKPDGFKLGNLLDRKRGFEKLGQNASDEETDASTNMLSSAQFA